VSRGDGWDAKNFIFDVSAENAYAYVWHIFRLAPRIFVRVPRARLNRRASQQAFPAVHRAPLRFPVSLPFHPVGVELLINPFVCPQVGILELCGPTCAGSMPGPSASTCKYGVLLCGCLGWAKLHFPSSHSILLPFCQSCHLCYDRNSIIYCCYILTTHLAILLSTNCAKSLMLILNKTKKIICSTIIY